VKCSFSVIFLAFVVPACPVVVFAKETAPPTDPKDPVALARGYAEQQEYEKVIETLQPTADLKNNYEANHLLGQAYYQTGKLVEARRCLQTAVELQPKSAPDHYLLAHVYLGEEKFALAVESYETTLRLGFDTAELHYKLATAYYRLRNYAGQVFTQTIKKGLAGRIVGDCYLIEPVPSKPDRFLAAPQASAIFHLQKALDAGLDTPQAHLLQADIWLGTRRYAKALQVYKTLEDRTPSQDRAAYHYAYARACLGVDDRQGYLDRLQKAIALDEKTYGPHLVDAYRQVADRYNAEGDLESYVRYLELAVAETPDSHDPHYLLGNALYEAGRTRQACRQWQITLELQPEHPDRTRMLELIRTLTTQGR